jgi:hypothetical protein
MTSFAVIRGVEQLHAQVGGAVGDLELSGRPDRVALLGEERRDLRLERVRHVAGEADEVPLVGIEGLRPVGTAVVRAGTEDEGGGCEQRHPAE